MDEQCWVVTPRCKLINSNHDERLSSAHIYSPLSIRRKAVTVKNRDAYSSFARPPSLPYMYNTHPALLGIEKSLADVSFVSGAFIRSFIYQTSKDPINAVEMDGH